MQRLNNRLVVGGTIVLTAAAVSGCGGGGGSDATPTVTVTATPTVTVTASPSTPASPTVTPTASPTATPVASQGFPEGSRYWTFQDGGGGASFAAYSKRSGASMCLIKMYPEYTVETGTVSDSAAGQQFAVNERAETMLNPYIPPYTATVTGNPAIALSMTWPAGTLVLNATDMAGAAAAIAASNPGTDGMEALARITPACG